MSSFVKTNGGLTLALAAMAAVSVAAVAQTSGSPFAKKTKKQAWETDAARPGPQTPAYQAPSYQPPVFNAPSPQAPTYIPPPNYTAPLRSSSVAPSAVPPAKPAYTPPAYSAPSAQPAGRYVPPATLSSGVSSAAVSPFAAVPQSYSAPSQSPAANYGQYNPPGASSTATSTRDTPVLRAAEPDLLPGFRRRPAAQAGAYYPGREDKGGFSVPAYVPRGQAGVSGFNPQLPQRSGGYKQANNQPSQGYGGPYGAPNGQSAQTPQNYPRQGYAPQSWKDRLGLGNLLTTFTAALKVGAAAVQRKNTVEDAGWNAGFIADGKVSGEVSAITRGGMEYGIGGELRGQYDKYRRGFGGRVGDCGAESLAAIAGCNSLAVDGVLRPLRGHTSQFYSAGLDNAKEAEFAVEGAYLFLRSAYGDITVGRDDGAAYLFSLGAPTLLAVNASNSPVDYTGLDSVRTVNEASGFAEKVAYVSPRLLGDQIGLGVQFGASYAPDARACGVDYCVRGNGRDGSGALSPDLEDVIEFGLSLDRTFSNGLSIEGTATYAMASEESGLISASGAGFEDLKSYGFGLEAEYGPWTLGGAFLNSNNGLINGDYEAYDIGLTFKPAQWGVSASYGHATDKNVNLLSDQATLGFVYDFDRFTLGTGVQYIERDVAGVAGGIFVPRKEKAAALFIEGGVKF